MHLDRFQGLKDPMPPSEIKKVSGINVVFGTTLFSFKKQEAGLRVWQQITKDYI